MSATNRGSKRIESDFYATPKSCIQNLLTHYGNIDGIVLEPSAGNGNIVSVIKQNGNNYVTALEIREEEFEQLKLVADEVVIGDFFEFNKQKKI